MCASVLLVAEFVDCSSDPSNVAFSDSATAAAISAWTAKMSLSSRSKIRDHNSVPSAALTSSATIRTLSPCFRTVPSRSVLTPSFSPIVLGSSFLSLKRKDELRPMILRSLIWPRAAISSSDRPSEKYSSPGSPLSLSNGSTAIDFCGVAVAASVRAGLASCRGIAFPAV